jgi:hypothetical protein
MVHSEKSNAQERERGAFGPDALRLPEGGFGRVLGGFSNTIYTFWPCMFLSRSQTEDLVPLALSSSICCTFGSPAGWLAGWQYYILYLPRTFAAPVHFPALLLAIISRPIGLGPIKCWWELFLVCWHPVKQDFIYGPLCWFSPSHALFWWFIMC